MLTRRTLMASTAALAAGCNPLESSFSAPSLPEVVELKWGTRYSSRLFDSGRKRLGWEKTVAQVVEALEADEENPNGPKRGRYTLKLHSDYTEKDWDEVLAWYGSEFDLLSVHSGFAQNTLGERGILLPLDPFIAIDGSDITRAFYPGLLDQFRSNTGLFALPVNANPMMLLYDPEYFAEKGVAPLFDANWDWGDLVEYALKLTQRFEDGDVRRWGLAIEWFGYWWAFWQNEADVVDPKSLQCLLKSRAAREALQFCYDLLHMHRVAPLRISTDRWRSFDSTLGPPPAMFFVPSLHFFGEPPFRWSMLPQGKVRSVPMTGHSGIGISAKSKNPEVAYTALKGLAGVMQRFVRVPAQKEAVARLGEFNKTLLPDEIAAIQQSMEYGRAIPPDGTTNNAMRAIEEGLVRGDSVNTIVNNVCSLIER